MFSTSTPLPPSISSSTRNPRRRQRNHSDENGVSLPRAKRQRSALSSDTFVKPGAEDEPVADRAGLETPANGSVRRGRSAAKQADVIEMPVRGAKKATTAAVERGSKTDGSIVLTKNNQYAVTKLPALPDRIRNNHGERAHGSIFPEASYALALSATHALIWPYATSVSSPETFSFSLPHPSRRREDPLPLGSLVTASASDAEPGLVIVMPLSGKVTYWESITSAAALDLVRQQRLGVDGSVGSMMSGEVVIHVENAEPAGFILSFSSGRIALLAVRDGQGRPSVTSQFLKGSAITGGGGGFFGGLKNVFGAGTWRRDVAAARAGPSKRSERVVGVATAMGTLQIWDVHRGGHHALQTDVDAREDMTAAIKASNPELRGRPEGDFELIDFAFLPPTSPANEISTGEEPPSHALMALMAFKGTDGWNYVLLEMTLSRDSIAVGLVHPIRCYTTPPPQASEKRPRVYVPRPFHTAFVVFDRAVVIASVVRTPDSPDQQLLLDSHDLPEPFEDVVDFREGLDVTIVGCAVEEGREAEAEEAKASRRRSRDPGCVLLVRGGGVVRITAHSPPDDPREVEAATVQSKIEQAIQYGVESQNLLNFAGRSETRFPLEEVEAAALKISRAIVDSNSKAITIVTPSMEYQLKQRSAALMQLAAYLHQTFPPLSRLTRWRLMWDAERLAAARAIWKLYDTRLRETGDRKKYALLVQLVDMMSEDINYQAREDLGELDRVRHWFVRNVARIEYLVFWAYNSVAEIQRHERQTMASLAGLISEANDLSLGALETAFRFRHDNMQLYGLQEERAMKGLLVAGYDGLPEFWTSTRMIIDTTKALVDLSREMAITYWTKDKGDDVPDPRVIRKIGTENVRQVEVCCQVFQERFRWCLAQDDDALKEEGRQVRLIHLGIRGTQIGKLARLGLTDQAVELAEKYHDMPTLVQLLADEITAVAERAKRPELGDDEAAELEDRIASLEKRVDRNFGRFGDDWAKALFTAQLQKGKLASMMQQGEERPDFLTRFLRSNPAYAKLSWMNDVLAEQNYKEAGRALLGFARKESDLWSRRVELSIGKLARLAASAQDGEDKGRRLGWVEAELELVNIQQRLYEHISPAVYGAIDDAAAVDLAMAEFGKRGVQGKAALKNILEQGLTELFARNSLGAQRLVDVLTLMDQRFDAENPEDLAGQEFHLALQALRLSRNENKADAELGERMIWRRCMIRDDWTAINDTQLKDDRAVERAAGGTALFATLKAGFKSGEWPRRASEAPLTGRAETAKEPFRPLRPSEVLGAGCTPQELGTRFPEDLREQVAHDLREEDARLQQFIEAGRLEDWYLGIVEAAKKSIAEDVAEEEEKAKKMKEVEESMATKVGAGTVVARKGKGVDAEGDVFMS
ncbi:MAG: hypothetical protein M1832_002979 [Thelocarpon impressellum]|nr:MAG: hypothetical protein M1832_002979 [Thelocarpon impressellum]